MLHLFIFTFIRLYTFAHNIVQYIFILFYSVSRPDVFTLQPTVKDCAHAIKNLAVISMAQVAP